MLYYYMDGQVSGLYALKSETSHKPLSRIERLQVDREPKGKLLYPCCSSKHCRDPWKQRKIQSALTDPYKHLSFAVGLT